MCHGAAPCAPSAACVQLQHLRAPHAACRTCTPVAHMQEAPCGHFMHSHCFAAYTRYSYTCPVCFKSLGDMSVYWKMIDSLLAAGGWGLGYPHFLFPALLAGVTEKPATGLGSGLS